MDSVALTEMGRNGGRLAPSSGWFVQLRSAKPMEKVSPAVGSGVTKAAAAATAAVTAAAVEAANKALAEAAKTELARSKKRTKTVRVPQEYIDALLERYPFKPYPGEASELEKNIHNPEKRELLRLMLAPTTALIKADRDKQEAIVKQYLAQGYAEEEVEVSDDEEEASEDLPLPAQREGEENPARESS